MNKIIIRLYTHLILYLQLLPILVLFISYNYLSIIKIFTAKHTYLKQISGTLQEQTTVLRILGDFHSLSDNEAFIPGVGLRPITITFIDDFIQNEYATDGIYLNGLAHVKWDSCDITISRKRAINKDKLIRTIIHEYLHCFGYSHVDNKKDLMYYYNRKNDPENVLQYSKDLNQRLK